MENPLVAFGAHHKRQARGFAGGGSVDEAKAVGDRMCNEYGVGCGTKNAAQAPQAQPAQPAPKPATSPGGMLGKLQSIISNRTAEIDKASGYAMGGVIRDNNSFSQDLTTYNPLTATGPTDRFGNNMTFTNSMKSQLSALTAPPAAPQTPTATPAVAPTAIAAPAATPVTPPQNPLTAAPASPFTGAYAPGGANDTHKAFARGGKIKGPGTPTSDSIAAEVNETGEPIKVSTQERILSKAQDTFLEKLARDQGFESLEAMLEAGTGKPVGPTINAGKRAAASGAKFSDERDYSIPADQWNEAQTAIAAAPKPVAQEIATPSPVDPAERFKNPDFSMIGADRKGYEQARKMYAPDAPTAAEASVQAANPLTSVAKAGSVRSLTSPNVPRAVKAAMPVDDYRPSATEDETGVRRINTDHGPMFTNVDGNGAAMGMAKKNPLTTTNMQAEIESLRRANEINQSITPKVAMLGDSGRAESQALMDKWGREDAAKEMMAEMGRNPKAANALASLFHSQQGTETALADIENRRGIADSNNATQRLADATQRRGQDIAAQTHAAQLAGNPLDNELKRTQVRAANMSIDKAREQDKLLSDIHAEADPAKRQSMIDGLLAGQGKNPAEHRFIKVDGGEETTPEGVKIKKPSGVFDAVTRQFVPMAVGAQSVASAPSQEEITAALATGKITKEEVIKRLQSAGHDPSKYKL